MKKHVRVEVESTKVSEAGRRWRTVLVCTWVVATTPAIVACFGSVKPIAARTMACDEGQISEERGTPGTRIARGCGHTDVFELDETGDWKSLRERAAYELSCGVEKVEVTVISASVFGAAGCGRKFSYKYVSQLGIVADTGSTTE